MIRRFVPLLVVAFFGVAGFGSDSNDPDVVSQVDLNRYMGQWKEIAHNPNFFQNGCIRSMAEYAVLSANEVSVHNTCVKEGGGSGDIQGVATIVDPSQPAKLVVKFNLFARGDYWIIDLDQNYQWAVVSAPQKKSLFILSRQAPMDEKLLQNILTSLKLRGFNTDDLIFDHY